ncbi:MAG: hypothetical protein M9932_09840 [Xanthobacteraceae bacterium]|nr:hypothetical protein [Xanthobacteraceae bacterium]
MRYVAMMVVATAAAVAPAARAQDVPGIEICTAEKDMARRTGCLQSNVDFLKTTMTKMALDHQRKLDAATRQIDALRTALTALQKQVDALLAAQGSKAEPAAPAKDGKDGGKDGAK